MFHRPQHLSATTAAIPAAAPAVQLSTPTVQLPAPVHLIKRQRHSTHPSATADAMLTVYTKPVHNTTPATRSFKLHDGNLAAGIRRHSRYRRYQQLHRELAVRRRRRRNRNALVSAADRRRRHVHRHLVFVLFGYGNRQRLHRIRSIRYLNRNRRGSSERHQHRHLLALLRRQRKNLRSAVLRASQSTFHHSCRQPQDRTRRTNLTNRLGYLRHAIVCHLLS